MKNYLNKHKDLYQGTVEGSLIYCGGSTYKVRRNGKHTFIIGGELVKASKIKFEFSYYGLAYGLARQLQSKDD